MRSSVCCSHRPASLKRGWRCLSACGDRANHRIYHHISQRILGPKSKLLLFSGPVLIVTQATVWATLLLLGISLIVWPQLGAGIVSSSASATESSFVAEVCYAGFSVTTLGVGDLVPTTAFSRMVTITAATIGFSFFTLVLAYIISVYSALGRRNQFASEIDFRTGRTGDTLAYLRLHLASNDRASKWTLFIYWTTGLDREIRFAC